MSNLIKSGKVIDLSVPVNVGISGSFNRNVDYSAEMLVNAIAKDGVSTENIIQLRNTKNQPLKEETSGKYIEESKKKAEELFEAEMKRAYDEGIERARQEAENIIKEATQKREDILNEISSFKEELLTEYKNEIRDSEKELLELSLEIAEKIINYEVDRSDEYILGIVKDSLERVIDKKDVTLKLSTSDYYTIMSNKKYLIANVQGFGEIEIIQDESMEPGTCIVDTPLGVIDGSIQVRMDNIQKEVQKMLSEQ